MNSRRRWKAKAKRAWRVVRGRDLRLICAMDGCFKQMVDESRKAPTRCRYHGGAAGSPWTR